MAHLDGSDDGVGYGVKGENSNDPAWSIRHIVIGVWGDAPHGTGVSGSTVKGVGVSGIAADTGTGVLGEGKNGVHGISFITSLPTDNGVWGENLGGGRGVMGTSVGGDGVVGLCKSQAHAGVSATNDSGGFGVWARGTPGGYFESNGGDGVRGLCTSNAHAGVSAENDSGGFGVWARGTPAGHFEGDVEVTGDIRLLNQDCAEDFEISAEERIEPGTVMVIDRQGALRRSQQAYDKRVAGVVSGAGDCRPGIILGRQQLKDNRMPVALVGKVHCNVDASYSPIEVGDLLTTSPTPGCAMKADDHVKAFGAVIGKALGPISSGRGLIPILVALQ